MSLLGSYYYYYYSVTLGMHWGKLCFLCLVNTHKMSVHAQWPIRQAGSHSDSCMTDISKWKYWSVTVLMKGEVRLSEMWYDLQLCPGRATSFCLGWLHRERNLYVVLLKICRQGFGSREDQAVSVCTSDQSKITCSSPRGVRIKWIKPSAEISNRFPNGHHKQTEFNTEINK